ncbi:MAG: hypothetical protein SFX18_04920 [Pirellulales bacterium]|nr:hypothetical protein [Pirellulales bacterium]
MSEFAKEFVSDAEDESVETLAGTTTAGERLSSLLNWGIGILAVLFVGGASFTAYQCAATDLQKRNPHCGLDYILWACGSEETFESALTSKIEESQGQLIKELGKKVKRIEMPDFENLQIQPIIVP